MMKEPSAPWVVVETETVDPPADNHLLNLKALTEKLRLETRRPSYLEWKARLETGPGPELTQTEENVENMEAAAKNKLTSDPLKRFKNMEEALSWLRRELKPEAKQAKRHRDKDVEEAKRQRHKEIKRQKTDTDVQETKTQIDKEAKM